MKTGRIEAFSDGVFAIALTLLVLGIATPPVRHDLGHELIRQWPSFAAYGVSVLLIGLIWANHHAMFEHIARGDRPLLFLNTVLLGFVGFQPLPTKLLAAALRAHHNVGIAAMFYGAVLAAGGVFFNLIWMYARRRHLLGDGISAGAARAVERRFLIGPLLYAIAAAIALVSPVSALLLYVFLIVFFWLPGRGLGHSDPQAEPAGHSQADTDAAEE
jgi:uncharacterized membrane protein